MTRDKSQLKDAFWQAGFGFVAEDRYRNVAIPAFIAKRENLHQTLFESGQLPDLKGAPVASWVLARVAHLSGRKFPYGWDEIVGSDGANFWLRYYCVTEDLNLGGLVWLSGKKARVDLSAHTLKEGEGEAICDAFVQALLANPLGLSECRVIVQYTEMTDPNIRFIIPRVYGWDGRRFLDEEAPEHAVCPEDYE